MKKVFLLCLVLAAIVAGGISDGAWAHPNDSCPFIGAENVWSYSNWGYGASVQYSVCQWDPYGVGWREWGPVRTRLIWGHY